jgi:hypothetical protein
MGSEVIYSGHPDLPTLNLAVSRETTSNPIYERYDHTR